MKKILSVKEYDALLEKKFSKINADTTSLRDIWIARFNERATGCAERGLREFDFNVEDIDKHAEFLASLKEHIQKAGYACIYSTSTRTLVVARPL